MAKLSGDESQKLKNKVLETVAAKLKQMQDELKIKVQENAPKVDLISDEKREELDKRRYTGLLMQLLADKNVVLSEGHDFNYLKQREAIEGMSLSESARSEKYQALYKLNYKWMSAVAIIMDACFSQALKQIKVRQYKPSLTMSLFQN